LVFRSLIRALSGAASCPLPKNKDDAEAFIDAYACLKLEMDRLKKHEDVECAPEAEQVGPRELT
jgi:hypothetical protein